MTVLRRRARAWLLTATLAVPAAVTVAVDQADAQTGAPPGSAGGPGTTVTLITGDRVTLLDGGGLAMQPGVGRADITFATKQVGERLQVVPSDAAPLLDAGRLDPRLFDVTMLIESGYDDRRGDLPLIVTGGGVAAAAAVTALDGVASRRSLPSVGGTAVRVDPDGGTFWEGITGGSGGQRALATGGTTIWLDGVREPTLDVSVPQIGAPAAWQAGYTGAGVTVAVVDTGIDQTHPDLADRVAQARDFTGTGGEDTEGHGTHVASTVAGSGAASGGRYQGVAPGVQLLAAKVCIGRSCPDSFIIAGMEWAVSQGAKVVNMSLSGTDTPELDPLEQSLNNLTEAHGTLFVTAAGNEGDDETVGSPASADAALAVGAVTKSNQLASFSSRGPRIGDAAIKPDVTAPGQEIVAARSSASSIGDPASQYAPLSGTSMAAPHVTGAAAILAQQLPDASPTALKATLMASATPNPSLGAFAQGAGRIDVSRAIDQQLTTSPPSLSFGRQPWPHDGDTPVEKAVTYHNSGTSPVTVDLTLDVRGPDGAPAPDGMFTASAGTITVPAGGEAQVTVTADTSVDGPVGFITGHLVAAGGGGTARTPVAVDREGLTHQLTVQHTDRAGNPASDHNTYLLSLDERVEHDLTGTDGSSSARVPPGRYSLISHVSTDAGDERSLTKLVQPLLTIDGDQTVDLDARLAGPMEVSVERPDASMILKEVTAHITADWGDSKYGVLSFSDTPMYSGNIGPDTPAPGFTSYFNTELIKLGPDGSKADSPFFYHLTWLESGRMFDGFSRDVRDKELAQVHAEHAAQPGGGDVQGAKATSFFAPGVGGGVSAVIPFRLPFDRTELYTTGDGLQWTHSFGQIGEGGVSEDEITGTQAPPVTYQAGQQYTSSWNQAVFTPALPALPNPATGVARSGDAILVNLALYGDQAGRQGFPTSSKGRTALYRDGVLVGESDQPGRGLFDVSPEPAEYRLEVTAEHDPRLELSRSMSAAWTFRSEHVEGGGGKGGAVPQALSAVRFLPGLDEHNTMPALRGRVVPVQVDRQAGATAAAVRELAVAASFDDGTTWQPVRTVLLPGGHGLVIMPPGQPGFVSLRASAVDAEGGSVEVTVIRAYQIVG
ncbi:MAG: S8 family serine peptidase [Micromonosporaceae bacterium]|nr:S8 family serine peptidase [Micromonosporaceae bacterium]